jgi:hypothetical protein
MGLTDRFLHPGHFFIAEHLEYPSCIATHTQSYRFGSGIAERSSRSLASSRSRSES